MPPALVSDDPAARLADGDANPLHVPVSRYQEALVALLVLAVVMLVTALIRRRLFVGIAMALYGLALFNLHYFGFAIPYLLGGAWFLVHAYREHKASLDAQPGAPPPASEAGPARRRANRRYTPPTSRPGS
jgi:fatty acid desaturase